MSALAHDAEGWTELGEWIVAHPVWATIWAVGMSLLVRVVGAVVEPFALYYADQVNEWADHKREQNQ